MPNLQRVSRLAFWSIVIAFLVMGIKFLAWWLSGSVALYSDALESIVNVLAAMVAWFAIRLSHKPPDKNHQFGHHKAEYLSAVIEGILIVVAALLIFQEAFAALVASRTLEEPGLGMAVNVVATIINAFWAWLLITTGKRERSPALAADGRHILADVVTSVGVLFGLVIVMLTGWVVLDAIMAIIVGANVLREGWKLVYTSANGLMDVSPDVDEFELIEKTILENAGGAIEVHDIKTRVAGPALFVEFHLVVDGNMSVAASHVICDRIEDQLKKTIKGIVPTIHVEPDPKSKAGGLKVT
ncbi:Cobalt-zinc-cadmium resistance protein [hydrothermal vent metagenome]|uniref:Cobalt-zinc-cadmium resistance protein n=1 Tax=hydrothermal vent metagenome TaxID=652676 RepID=A0A3B0SMP9_9ZZZZ